MSEKDFSPVASGRRRIGLLIALGALSAFGPLSMDLYLPSLPELGEDLEATDSVAQLTMSMCMIGLALGQLLAGPLSDRIGRRRPLIAGVAVYVVASALCALAQDIWTLIGLRSVQGLAGAAGIVIARAMVSDMFTGARAARVFAALVVVTGLAPVLAPLAGGQMARFTDWRGLFVALAVIGALLLAASLALPETLSPAARHAGGLRETGRSFRALLRDRLFVGYALVLAFSTCGMFVYISLGTFVLQDEYGISTQAFSFVFAGNSLGLVLAANLGRFAGDRLGLRGLLVIGVAASTAGGAFALIADLAGWGLAALLAGVFLAVSSVGLVMPQATALAMGNHRARAGAASAVLGSAQFLTGAVIPPLVSAGGATGASMTAGITACGTLSLVFCLLLTREGREQEPALSAGRKDA